MNNMNKKIMMLLTGIAVTLSMWAQVNIPEPEDPAPAPQESWQGVGKTIVGWGSTDVRYLRSEVATELKKSLSLRAWKGERVSAQAVLSTPDDIRSMSFSVSDLKSGSKVIAADNVKQYFVRYVIADKPGDLKAARLQPDLLSSAAEMTVAAATTRPVWLDIHVPATAKAGKYTGQLTLAYDGKQSVLPFTLEVIDRTLPEPKEWTFHLDLWQNPYAVARYFDVPLWSQEHFDRMRPIMERLAAAGQKVITCSVIRHPWNSQTYDPFETMIAKMKQLDGSWKYDYAVFDKWVEFMMSCGITEQIDCYTIVPWHYQFEYYDCASNTLKTAPCRPGEQAYHDFLLPFLKDLARHLKAKGWFEKTCISMDERPLDQLEEAWKVVKEADKDYRFKGAANFDVSPGSFGDRMYDLSMGYRYKVHTGDALKHRLESGRKLTFYTCCSPARPNTFIYSKPAESTYLGWHAAAINYSGYLRWAYCSWPEDPVQDTRFGNWQSGDTFLSYPEGSSIRLERLVEGIQDYEKIRILRETVSTRKMARFDTVLKKFSHNVMADDFDIDALVREGKAALRAIE
jgi:hypothetical protein